MSNEIEYTIRQATLADAQTLTEFNCAIASETENKTLDRKLVLRGVSRAFDQGDEAIYFVAECSSDESTTPIGSLMLTREWSDWRDGWLAWIQSVYVAPQHRGRGVFRRMLHHATAFLQQQPDVRGLRLYVEEENSRAQSVYFKNGFSDSNYKVLEKLF